LNASAPAIEVTDVWLAFDGSPVLTGVSFRVERGEFLGLIGPNGAGKTKLLEVILGLLRPDRGSVRVLGRPPSQAREAMAYVPQFARFDRRFPARVDNVVEMGLLGPRAARPPAAERRQRARAALERVGAADLARRPVGELSGGQLQRVLVARALAMDRPILLLDEPTASLDARTAGAVYDLLGALVPRHTVVLVAHDVGVISRRVDRVACLNRRLFVHAPEELGARDLAAVYGHPVDIVVHEAHGEGSREELADSDPP
jgi:zinc transport system ATP-binding protein